MKFKFPKYNGFSSNYCVFIFLIYQQNSMKEPERGMNSGENSTMMVNTHNTLITASTSKPNKQRNPSDRGQLMI